MQRCPFGTKTASISGMCRVAADPGNYAVIGFDEHAATDTAITTSGFDFSFHDFPSGMTTATAMPPLKIMGLNKKQGKSKMNLPCFGASTAAVVPI